MDRKRILANFMGLFLVCMTMFSKPSIAGIEQEKDHISSTQSGVVLVTSELLNREGEPGPASPSFKMPDTAKFLVKKPYEEAEIFNTDQTDNPEEENLLTDLPGEWFLEGENNKDAFTSEPIDRK